MKQGTGVQRSTGAGEPRSGEEHLCTPAPLHPCAEAADLCRGFSALEVLIAASVTALALLAVASMFPTGYQNIHFGGGLTIATNLTQRKLEELRNQTFTTLASLNTSATPPNSPPSVSESPITMPGVSAYSFTRNTWVNVEGIAPYRTAKITVIVSWGEGPLGTREVKLESRVAE